MDIRRFIGTVALGMAAAVMLAGVSLAFLAWQHRSAPFALSALLVVLAAPALAVAAVLMRMGQVEECAPAAALVDALGASETALRVIRMARAHAWVIVSYAVVLWVCQGSGLIDAREFLYGFTFIVVIALVIALAAYLPWLGRQERRALERLNAGRHRLREARAAQGWFVG